MTREEAIKHLSNDLFVSAKGQLCVDVRKKDEFMDAIGISIDALRPVSREKVKTAWKGCKHCTEEWGTCDPITNRFRMPPRGGIQFCPMCGRPLTDKAMDMMIKRLDACNGYEKQGEGGFKHDAGRSY